VVNATCLKGIHIATYIVVHRARTLVPVGRLLAYECRSVVRLLSAACVVIQFKTLCDRDLIRNHLSSAGDAEQYILINAEPLAQCAEWLNNRAATGAKPIGLDGKRDLVCVRLHRLVANHRTVAARRCRGLRGELTEVVQSRSTR